MKYFITINEKKKRRDIQLIFGIFITIIILSKTLSFYYRILFINTNSFDTQILNEKKATNDINFANKMFYEFGISIRYHDFKSKEKIFIPSKLDIELKKQKDLL